ncbi:putative nucleoredoxin 1 [Bienertia sinuspersici]
MNLYIEVMDVKYEIVEPVKKYKKKKVPTQVKTKTQEILWEVMQSKEKEILREFMRSSKQILRELMRSKKKEILRDLMQLKKEILRELMQSKKKEIPKLNKKKKKKKEDEIPEELEVLKDMNIDKEELRNYFFPGNPLKPWDELMLSQCFDDFINFDRQLHEDEPFRKEVKPVIDATKKLKNFIDDQCHMANYEFESNIKLGGFVDIESLLFPRPNDYLVSRGGRVVTAENLSGKFVLICCFFLPVCYSSCATWKIAAASYDMYSKLKGNFEMVIVAKMRRGWTHDKVAFTSFLDGFPPNCLAVPFHAKSHRHRVCKSLGGLCCLKTLLVDPNQTVLIYTLVSDGVVDYTSFVPLYGAKSTPFPFVSRKFFHVSYAVPTKAMRNLKIPSSLEDFLCCKTSDIVSRKILLVNGTFHQENVSISGLKSKLVGLYLFTSGHMIRMLPKIAQACSQHGKELEIVLVYFPGENTTLNPQSAEQDLLNVLAKRNLPWWVAPYNSTASIMLDHMFDLGEKLSFWDQTVYLLNLMEQN